MSTNQVIACFVICSNEQIVYQGTFRVSESLNSASFPSTDGSEFLFSHSYEGTECNVELSCKKDGSVVTGCHLAIPINRTKIKWKQASLGTQYEIHYRCQLEDWDSGKLMKQLKKQRGKAAMRENGQVSIPIHCEGDAKPNGSGPSGA